MIYALEPMSAAVIYLNNEDGWVDGWIEGFNVGPDGGDARYSFRYATGQPAYKRGFGVVNVDHVKSPSNIYPSDEWLGRPNLHVLDPKKRDKIVMLPVERDFWNSVEFELNSILHDDLESRPDTYQALYTFSPLSTSVRFMLVNETRGGIVEEETVFRAPCLAQYRLGRVWCPQSLMWRGEYYRYIVHELHQRFVGAVAGVKPKGIIARIKAGE